MKVLCGVDIEACDDFDFAFSKTGVIIKALPVYDFIPAKRHFLLHFRDDIGQKCD